MEKIAPDVKLGSAARWGNLPDDVSHAASIGDTKSVILWVTSGFPIDAYDRQGFTLAGSAAYSGQDVTFRRLAEFRADMNLPCGVEWLTPAMLAAKNRHAGILRISGEFGADFSLRDKKNRTALVYACDAAMDINTSCVTYLLDQIDDGNGGHRDIRVRNEGHVLVKSDGQGVRKELFSEDVLLINAANVNGYTAAHALMRNDQVNTEYHALTKRMHGLGARITAKTFIQRQTPLCLTNNPAKIAAWVDTLSAASDDLLARELLDSEAIGHLKIADCESFPDHMRKLAERFPGVCLKSASEVFGAHALP